MELRLHWLLVSCSIFSQSVAWIADRGISTLGEEEDIANLRGFLRTVSYRDLFRPVLKGTYYIKNKNGKYLKRNEDNQVAETDDKCKTCGWEIKEHEAFGEGNAWPSHRIMNGKTFVLSSLPGGKASGKDGKWHLMLDSSTAGNGIFYDFQSAPDFGNIEGEWMLEPIRGVGGWFRWLQVKRQWRVAKKLPVFPGTDSMMTWEKLCRVGACEDDYAKERKRHRSSLTMLVKEDKNHYVTQNKVRSICDWSIPSLTNFAYSAPVLRELADLLPGGCPENGLLHTTNMNVKKAMELECFQTCQEAIDTKLIAEPVCTAKGAAPSGADKNWTKFFEQVLSSDSTGCVKLPGDSLEDLGNFGVQKQCLFWPEPSLIFQPQDDAPGDLMSQDSVGTCSIPHYDAAFSKSAKDIIQSRRCPEGSTCQCPRTDTTKTAQASSIRDGSRPLFVYPGSALIPKLVKGFTEGAIVEVAARIVWHGNDLALAIKESYVAWPFRFGQSAGLIKGTWGNVVGFRCANTVGCWPNKPVRTKTDSVPSFWRRACRAHPKHRGDPNDEIMDSSVWFMPPPGLKFHFVGFACGLAACSKDELKAQKVGFGRKEGKKQARVGNPNLYNCQPLAYDGMTGEQQTEFKATLRRTRGTSTEYTQDLGPPTVTA